MDYNEILDFGEGPTKSVEEKQFDQKMRQGATGQYAKEEEGKRKQEDSGNGRESPPKSMERGKQAKKEDEGYHQEDARNIIMERLRAQLLQRNVKRKRRRRKKTGDKTKDDGTQNKGGVTMKEELGIGEACKGINEEAEKLIPNKDVQKPQTEGEYKHNTKVVEVDVVPSVPVNLTVDVADDNGDDDDDGFMPRRLFFFSFSQFKSDEKPSL